MEQSKFQELPIAKYFDNTKVADTLSVFRRGEKGAFNFLKFGVLVGVGILAWKYILPPLFMAIGATLAAITGVVLVGAFIIMLPVIFKGLRMFTRFVHKILINYDPIGELNRQLEMMREQIVQFRLKKTTMIQLEQKTIGQAKQAEEMAKEYQTKFLSAMEKTNKIKQTLSNIEKEKGKDAELDATYQNENIKLVRTLNEAQRFEMSYKQEKEISQKYAVRGNILKQFNAKIVQAELGMEMKTLAFESSIDWLKRDYEFARESKETSQAMRDAMLFSNKWEVETAIEQLSSRIALDIAHTSSNFKDIDSLTMGNDFDKDEIFNRLSSLTERITIGTEVITDVDNYTRDSYQLTAEDKRKSGGFTNFFN